MYVLDDLFIGKSGTKINYPFGFAPTYHRYRLDWPEKVKTGANIFVGSMADVFGKWVPDSIIQEIFEHCNKYNMHNFLFLTKNPARYLKLEEKGLLPQDSNMWYGTSVPTPDVNYFYSDKHNTFLSIEPILEPFEKGNIKYVDWVIIGAETGHRKNKVVPKKEWIDSIVNVCDEQNVPVFMKNSLISIMGEENMRREFPEALINNRISAKQYKKLYDKCLYCKQEMPMKNMIALLYRTKRGESAKKLGYACKECFNKNFGGAVNEKTQLQNDE